MQIKFCTKKDIADLIEVSTQSYIEHYTYLWLDNGENYIKSNFNYEKFEDEISNSNSALFLIPDGQKFVGLIKLNIDSAANGFSAEQALELERIYFIKEASGKGFGKDAVTYVANFAKQRNKKIVWLKAISSSPAIEFYKKLGFVIIAETNLNYPGIRDEFKKMYLMQLNL